MGERRRGVELRQIGLSLLVSGAVLSGLSCGGGDIQAPTNGTIEITTATGGPEPDTDGYTISIDHGTESAIAVNATMQRGDLEPGSHSVQLGGLVGNCIVAGENPRTINVPAGETTTVTFQVTCSATVGSLQITSATTGFSPDPDGYTISLDGSEQGALAVNGAATLDGLTPGSHAVGLSGVAANCQAEGENPRAITIKAGESVSAAFAIVCVAPLPGAGSLQITTSTSGPDPDPNGYAFAMDGGSRQPIAINATETLANVAMGAHTVRLSGLAANCSVQGANSRSVTVTTGTTAQVSFAITCTATTGSLTITTTTTGPSPDPDGYTASVDAGTGQPIGPNATLPVPNLTAGTHRVTLAGLAANCAVQGKNPRTVTIVAAASAVTTFTIVCRIPSVRWTRMTSGTDFDLEAVSGRAATDVFAVGRKGMYVEGEFVNYSNVVHFDGQSWSEQYQQRDILLYDVWAASTGEAFAVGYFHRGPGIRAALLHYDGSTWAEMPGPAFLDVFLRGVWGSSRSDVFAVGSAVTSSIEDPLYVEGRILHYNGETWSLMDVPDALELRLVSVWGNSATNVYATGYLPGEGGFETNALHVLHYDGVRWTTVYRETGQTVQIPGLWVSTDNHVFALGGDRVLHYDQTSWSKMTVGAFGLWGSSATDVYGINQDVRGINPSTILHYDGRTWKRTEVEVFPRRIWGSSATDIFAVGYEGSILHGTL